MTSHFYHFFNNVLLWLFLFEDVTYFWIHTFIIRHSCASGCVPVCFCIYIYIWGNICVQKYVFGILFWKFFLCLTFAKHIVNADFNHKWINYHYYYYVQQFEMCVLHDDMNIFVSYLIGLTDSHMCLRVFFLMTSFIFAYADEQALQFGNYSTMLKQRERPLVLWNVVLNIADQCVQHEQQTEKKGAFQHF